MSDTLTPLIDLTRILGQPERDYVIIGEGNTSLRIDDDVFWVKASGARMQNIDTNGFVAVHLQPILDILDQPDLTTDAMKQATRAARVDPDAPGVPSIEVTFHAALLADCNARCIAHTHPTSVNKILCSSRAEQFASHRQFPDEIVLCGPSSVFVPYADPGLPLARAIREKTRQYIDSYGEPPKVILLGNHGLIVVAQSPGEALNLTAMCVKAAEVFIGACSIGEPTFLSADDTRHIHRRLDEIYRRRQFIDRS